MHPPPPRNRSAISFGILTLAVTGVALAGSIGYARYPRFDLAAASGAGLLVLAVAAGVASFFSPCSFPLLVTLLGREERAARGRWRIAVLATAMAGGAVLFLLLAGAVIGLGGDVLVGGVTFTSATGRIIRASLGTLLLVMGLAQLGTVRLPFDRIADVTLPLMHTQARLRRERPIAGYGLYGFTYVLAGFG